MFKNPSKLGINGSRSGRSCGLDAGMMQESLASLTHTNFTHTHTHACIHTLYIHTHTHYVTGLEILEEKKGIWSCGPVKKKAEVKAPQPSKAKEAGERPRHLKNWQNWTTCLTNLWCSNMFQSIELYMKQRTIHNHKMFFRAICHKQKQRSYLSFFFSLFPSQHSLEERKNILNNGTHKYFKQHACNK